MVQCLIKTVMTEDSRGSMFTRICDRQNIVDFVKDIEKHQCLYDQNSYQYVDKVLKRRIWSEIARKYNSTVPDCKEKWRKIRIAYNRSLKLSKSRNPPTRPYYLANYLHFISPDKKTDDDVPTTNSPPSPVTSEASLKLEIDEYDHLGDTNDGIGEKLEKYNVIRQEERTPISNQNHDRIIHNTDNIETHRFKEVNIKEANTGFQERTPRDTNSSRDEARARFERQKSYVMDENNPRRMFLMSLLPDIETLNEQEMRTFRREAIALLDRIMATRDTVIINGTR